MDQADCEAYDEWPALVSPRPIALPEITGAQRLMDMVELEAELQDNIKHCVVEPVSPRPVALPFITDAERLMKIAREQEEERELQNILFAPAAYFESPRPVRLIKLDSFEEVSLYTPEDGMEEVPYMSSDAEDTSPWLDAHYESGDGVGLGFFLPTSLKGALDFA